MELTYKEAEKKLLTVEWKLEECGTKDCWCSIIVPKEKIENIDDEDIYVLPSGAITTELAEHIVKIHNESLKN